MFWQDWRCGSILTYETKTTYRPKEARCRIFFQKNLLLLVSRPLESEDFSPPPPSRARCPASRRFRLAKAAFCADAANNLSRYYDVLWHVLNIGSFPA